MVYIYEMKVYDIKYNILFYAGWGTEELNCG